MIFQRLKRRVSGAAATEELSRVAAGGSPVLAVQRFPAFGGHSLSSIAIDSEDHAWGRPALGHSEERSAASPQEAAGTGAAPVQLKKGNKFKRSQKTKPKKEKKARKKRATVGGATMDDWDNEAWDNSVTATRPLLPGTHAPVVNDRPGLGISANTAVLRNQIAVTYDPEDDELPNVQEDDERDYLSNKQIEQRIGTLTQTFTHELAVHGNTHGLGADDEHNAMHDPTTRGRYLIGSRAAFNRLKNAEQKRSFAQAWYSDMNDQIDEYEEMSTSKADVRERRAWALDQRKQMLAAAKNPTKRSWT